MAITQQQSEDISIDIQEDQNIETDIDDIINQIKGHIKNIILPEVDDNIKEKDLKNIINLILNIKQKDVSQTILECEVLETITSLMIETDDQRIGLLCKIILELVQKSNIQNYEVDLCSMLNQLVQLLFNINEDVSDVGKQSLIQVIDNKPNALQALNELGFYEHAIDVLNQSLTSSQQSKSSIQDNQINITIPKECILNILEVVHKILGKGNVSEWRIVLLREVIEKLNIDQQPKKIKQMITEILHSIEEQFQLIKQSKQTQDSDEKEKDSEQRIKYAEQRVLIAEQRLFDEQNSLNAEKQENLNLKLMIQSKNAENQYLWKKLGFEQPIFPPPQIQSNQSLQFNQSQQFNQSPQFHQSPQSPKFQQQQQEQIFTIPQVYSSHQPFLQQTNDIMYSGCQQQTSQNIRQSPSPQISPHPMSQLMSQFHMSSQNEQHFIAPFGHMNIKHISPDQHTAPLSSQIRLYSGNQQVHSSPYKTRVRSPSSPKRQQSPSIIYSKIPQMSKEEEIKRHFICELTNKIMTDPVSIDGPHYFERDALMDYIKDTGMTPVTKQKISTDDITEEPELKDKIQRYLRDNPQRKLKK